LLEVLGQREDHPTAEQLLQAVRQRKRRISLATVYRNLDVLEQMGKIRKIESPGEQMRFDACLDPHFHVRCRSCGQIADLAIPAPRGLTGRADRASDFRVDGFRLEFTGLCKACLQDESNASDTQTRT
jgi:Fe2+ or Zn2+ uptake regulation protein